MPPEMNRKRAALSARVPRPLDLARPLADARRCPQKFRVSRSVGGRFGCSSGRRGRPTRGSSAELMFRPTFLRCSANHTFSSLRLSVPPGSHYRKRKFLTVAVPVLVSGAALGGVQKGKVPAAEVTRRSLGIYWADSSAPLDTAGGQVFRLNLQSGGTSKCATGIDTLGNPC
jgi:hypothetical protein